MSQKVKISKKQLKEDAFVSATFEAGQYLKDHMTQIIFGVVGVFVVIGIVWMVINSRTERFEQSGLAYFRAQTLYVNGQYALAASDFDRLSDEYSGTAHADKATYFAGDSYFKSGQYDQALLRFESAVDNLSEDDLLYINALIGEAAVYEQRENYEFALEYLNKALDASSYDFQKLEIMMSIARVQNLQGNKDQAIATYDKIIEDYPDAQRTMMAKELRAEIKASMVRG